MLKNIDNTYHNRLRISDD